MTTTRLAGLLAVAVGVGIGLAGPAAAEPLNGDYTGAVVDGGGKYREGKTATWTFTACGPECTRLGAASTAEPLELHLQGNAWVGTHPSNACLFETTIDSTSLLMTRVCGAARVVWQLAKAG